MKKSLVFTLLLAVMLTCASVVSAAAMTTSVMTFGDVKVHTASTTGGLNAVIVEKDKLVLFDAFDGEDGAALKKYVDSLGKPVDRIVLSHAHDHHWTGINKLFPGVALYSVDAEDINKASNGTLKVQPLANGTLVVDGVTYDFVAYKDIGAWVIKMPAQKVAMVHHLGYVGLHVPMPPMATRLDILKGLERDGYVWFIGGHAKAPVDTSLIQITEKYTDVVTKAVAANKDPQGAKADIMAAYPDWAGEGLLDMMLPLFYPK